MGPGALLLAAAIKAVLLVAGMVAVMTLPLPQLAVEFLYSEAARRGSSSKTQPLLAPVPCAAAARTPLRSAAS